MNLDEKRNIIVYINMFVHYPQSHNANTICTNFNEFFEKENLLKSINDQNCYVMINSAPFNEKESLQIEIGLKSNKTLINKEVIISKLKEFVQDYFKNQINEIKVEFTNNN